VGMWGAVAGVYGCVEVCVGRVADLCGVWGCDVIDVINVI
jgi:hypothetical protein